MENQFGRAFKEIRQKKGFKARDVAEGIVSVQFLRRFEKGEADIRLSNFYELLKKINLSFEDFMYLCHEGTLDRALNELDAHLDHAILNGDSILLVNLMKEYEQSYKKTGEIRFLHFNIICKIYYNRLFNPDFEIDRSIILSYLDRCETWTKYEFFIANHAVHTFDMDALYNLTILALDNKNGSRELHHFALDFCFHATAALIGNNRDDDARSVLHHYYNNTSVKKILPQLSFNIAMRFLEGILLVKEDEDEGHRICNEIINFYKDTIGYEEYANSMHKYYVSMSLRR
ncbi:MAG: helix-turn-helix transcriptional regulator [Bacillota bacterium]|nr:helix-turn-helix transcriptional regulator [Bacillota bacterium]